MKPLHAYSRVHGYAQMRIEMHMRISMLGFVGSLYNTKEECDQIMDFRLEQTYFGVKSEMLVYSDNQVS